MVDQKKAALAEAEQNVKQLKAGLDQATAAAERANAQRELAQQNYDRQAELFEKKIIAQATLDTFTRNLETAKQSLVGARAEEERARLAYSSNIEGVNTTVARLSAELADAQWDLDQTVTRAPAAGFVTQVALRPGMYVVPAPLRPVMVFVNTDKRDQEFTAAFQQNSLQRVKAGDEAEAAFDAVPGRVFKGKVRLVLDAIAAGQLAGDGNARGCRRPDGRRPGAGCHRHRGRHVALSNSARRRRAGRDLYRALAPCLVVAQNPAAHAQLAELHLPRGPLTVEAGAGSRGRLRRISDADRCFSTSAVRYREPTAT